MASLTRSVRLARTRFEEIQRRLEVEKERLGRKVIIVKYVHITLVWNLEYKERPGRYPIYASIALDYDVLDVEDVREKFRRVATMMVEDWVEAKFGPNIKLRHFKGSIEESETPPEEEDRLREAEAKASEVVYYSWWWGRSEIDRKETDEGTVEWEGEIPTETTWRASRRGRRRL